MRFHAFHYRWKWKKGDEKVCLLGFVTGRAPCDPEAKWIYSFRLFIGPLKLEFAWLTGVNPHFNREEHYA